MSIDQPRTLVLGLGNPLLADDAIGLEVVRSLQERLPHLASLVEIEQDHCGGLRLMERLIGYHRAIIVDAVCTGARPGTIHLLNLGGLPTRHSTCAHDVDLATALDLGRKSGATLPTEEHIVVIGIEAADVTTFRQGCTGDVAAAIPEALKSLIRILENWRTQTWCP